MLYRSDFFRGLLIVTIKMFIRELEIVRLLKLVALSDARKVVTSVPNLRILSASFF
jgi:hypothetical protein